MNRIVSLYSAYVEKEELNHFSLVNYISDAPRNKCNNLTERYIESGKVLDIINDFIL